MTSPDELAIWVAHQMARRLEADVPGWNRPIRVVASIEGGRHAMGRAEKPNWTGAEVYYPIGARTTADILHYFRHYPTQADIALILLINSAVEAVKGTREVQAILNREIRNVITTNSPIQLGDPEPVKEPKPSDGKRRIVLED